MAVLADIYIKAETLKTLANTVAKKGDKGLSLTISIDDNVNDYGQNVSQFVSQTKEEREDKKPRFYVGNGKVFWTNGKVAVAPKKEVGHTPKQEYQAPNTSEEEVPF